MPSRLTVLNSNVSGMNRFLLSSLHGAGWELTVLDVPLPRGLRLRSALRSVHPRLREWKARHARALDRAEASSRTFLQRTRWCERALATAGSRPEVVLQISGMFAPGLRPPAVPYAVFLSWTRALSEREHRPWVPDLPEGDLAAWRALEGRLYRGAGRLFVTNEYVRRSLMGDYGVPAHRMVTTGYGVPFEAVPAGERRDDGRSLLFVGYDFQRKGGAVLLTAFREVRRRVPGARLRIVGSGAPAGPAEEGVEFLGAVRDRAALSHLYRRATLFVLPTICEPFGLVFLEAMAHGVPCVATRVDALPEIIPDDVGCLVPPRDARALAGRIVDLLEDAPRRQAMGERAAAWVQERFSWQRVAAIMDRELRALAGSTVGQGTGAVEGRDPGPLRPVGLTAGEGR